MRTSNTALGDKTFDGFSHLEGTTTMTLAGTVFKTGFLVSLVVGVGAFVWSQYPPNYSAELVGHYREVALPPGLWGWLVGGAVGGFIVALITIFNPKASPITAPIYAALEGAALGSFSIAFEASFPGIVAQAVMLTVGTLFALLVAYTSGVIKATENFKLGVVAATGGICLVYIGDIFLRMFGIEMPFIHETGWAGIAVSAFVVLIAALNLVLDFDFIEKGVSQSAPKYMEWYAGFGLLVTLVWLYLEIIKLLAKARSK